MKRAIVAGLGVVLGAACTLYTLPPAVDEPTDGGVEAGGPVTNPDATSPANDGGSSGFVPQTVPEWKVSWESDAGIDDVRAELRPEDKARIVAELNDQVPTAMIGDGINDTPALAGATVGIAMGATGSDAAIESADVAFTGHDLRLIPQALAHANRGGRIINQNIVLSLVIITVLLPLAITGVLGLAAVVLVHEVAEVVVIANGLRAAKAQRTELTPLDQSGSAQAADNNAVVTA